MNKLLTDKSRNADRNQTFCGKKFKKVIKNTIKWYIPSTLWKEMLIMRIKYKTKQEFLEWIRVGVSPMEGKVMTSTVRPIVDNCTLEKCFWILRFLRFWQTLRLGKVFTEKSFSFIYLSNLSLSEHWVKRNVWQMDFHWNHTIV